MQRAEEQADEREKDVDEIDRLRALCKRLEDELEEQRGRGMSEVRLPSPSPLLITLTLPRTGCRSRRRATPERHRRPPNRARRRLRA